MKKYRLKQWYPRIPVYLEDGYIISFDDDKGIAIYEFVNGVVDTFEMSGAELNCTQYWELIEDEKPLFVTEDGVEVFSDIDNLFAINLTYFSKTQNTLRSSRWLIDNPSYKVFSLESIADEYIWKNKPLFSYEDFIRYGDVPYERVIELLAKERIGQ